MSRPGGAQSIVPQIDATIWLLEHKPRSHEETLALLRRLRRFADAKVRRKQSRTYHAEYQRKYYLEVEKPRRLARRQYEQGEE